MLATLKVRDLVLIEDVSLDFGGGLNVLTGETGAGKSILLDALGLAAGSRAGGRSSVRSDAAQGSAVAIFDLPRDHAALRLVGEQGIACDGELILRRTLSADGRSRAFVNDEPVGVAFLRDLGAALVEVHGQADDRGLFDTTTHRALLDSFGGHEALARGVRELFEDLQRLRQEAIAMRRETEAGVAEAEYLGHAARELTELDAKEGEEGELAGARAWMMNASRIIEDVSATIDALSGDKGIEGTLATVLRRLSRLNEEARKKTASAEASLDQAFQLMEDARRQLETVLSAMDADPSQLERKEERLFAIRAAARKFSVKPDQLPAVLAEFRAKLMLIESSDARLRAVEERIADARAAYAREAAKLSAGREKSARRLEAAVAAEFAPLKLAHAGFRVSLDPVDAGESAAGAERVSFEIATIAGASFGSLTRIASGGELARFSLALKVALAEASPPATLVFDEVDRGVGGAVADAIGVRLQNLAKSTQTLLVTHSPQVAARAERHFRISRIADRTKVHLLSDSERIEEIARMLAGAKVTDEARAAARRLLAEANEPRKSRKRA